ncbi:MAG: tetratricopeptide repeat protein [Roseivirga sp.]|nr:tetratricopeptide repeat protein [Roseivirga sp.]
MKVKTVIIAFSCFLLANKLTGQRLTYTDSLKHLLETGKYSRSDQEYLSILSQLAIYSPTPEENLKYADILLDISFSAEYSALFIKAYQAKGVAHRMKGNLDEALNNLLESAELALDHQEFDLLAEAYLEIGTTYSTNDDLKNALIYENKAITLFRRLNKKQELAINLLNTGYSYYSMNQYDTALLYYTEAGPIFDSLRFTIGQAYTLGNQALIFWKTGKTEVAERDLLQAIDMLIPLGDQYGIADYHNQLGNLYFESNRHTKAIYHLRTGLDIALKVDLKEQIRDASQLISQLYAGQQNYDSAYIYHQQYALFKDSLENAEQTREMADQRTTFEVNLREKEIDTLEQEKKLQQTYVIITITLLALSVVAILYFRQRFHNTKLLTIAERKEHDDKIKDLLKNQETKALQSMVQGKEEERRHLAKELHNHLGSLLATVKVNLNGLESKDEAKQEKIIGLVDQACQDVRNLSHELHMGVSENFGLIPALKELTSHLQRSNDLQVQFSASIDNVLIDSQSEILIYRIVQELVSNVLKHARATKLTISLTGFEEGNLVNILVEDNGKGFEPEKLNKESKGIGLDSLMEMIRKLDGEIEIDSSFKSGTTVSADIPFEIPNSSIAP